jgi:hypothetical protein
MVNTGAGIKPSTRKPKLGLPVNDEELNEQFCNRQPESEHFEQSYARLYVDHLLQSDQNSDMDFTASKNTRPVTRENH